MKKRMINTKGKMMSCTGCGRHKKYVSDDVTAYFCSHCFMSNGNYNRYLKGLPLIVPMKDIHVKDILLGANGKEYKVIGKGEYLGEDKIFPVVENGKKDVVFLGDYFFIKKINK